MKIKIGLQITEQEYRELNYPSYSLLSNVVKSNAMAIGSPSIDISDLDPIIIGSLVDSIITDGGIPDNMVLLSKKPSGKAIEIIKALSKRTDLIDKNVMLSVKNKNIIEEELNNFKYYNNSSFDIRLNKLKNFSVYAKALLKHGEKAMFVTPYQLGEAKTLSNNLITRYPFLLEENNVVNQVKIIGKVRDVEIKGMLDFIYINHKEKLIIPFDLKTGMGEHFEFFEKGYLGWNYYIQASLYRKIFTDYIRLNHPEYDKYKIDNFRFMYCGRKDKLPIIYKVTDKLHEAGFSGFNYKKEKFTGIYELLDEYKYYKENPNNPYKKGFDSDEVIFDDNFL